MLQAGVKDMRENKVVLREVSEDPVSFKNNVLYYVYLLHKKAEEYSDFLPGVACVQHAS